VFLATTNKANKLLVLTYIGHVRTEELRRGRESARLLLADLKPGFRILADFERMDRMDTSAAQELGKMMEEADEKGVETIVRVIPHPSQDIGLNILAMFHYKRQLQMVTCKTMEEAAKVLGL
jgi:anti-anti-sigma regulatory factor